MSSSGRAGLTWRGMASPSTAHDQELLAAARDGDEDAYRRLLEPYHGELHAHCYRMLGSVHDAEDALQDASLRAWRGLAKFEGRSSLRSWLYTIATNTCLNQIARRPKRVLPVDYGPAADPHGGPGEPVVESVWVEPYPDETLGSRGRARIPGGALRAARGRRAGLHRGAPAAAPEPARRPDPARGARVLRPGGGGLARHVGGLGEQRPPARPQDRRGAHARAEPAGHPALARRRRPQRDRGPLRRGLGAERLRDRGRDARRGRDLRDAAARHLVRRHGRDPHVPRGLAAVRRLALAPDPHHGERPAGAGVLRVGRRRAGLPPVRAERPHLPRREDQRRRRVRRASHGHPRHPVLRALGGRANGPEPAVRELRALRPARTTGGIP